MDHGTIKIIIDISIASNLFGIRRNMNCIPFFLASLGVYNQVDSQMNKTGISETACMKPLFVDVIKYVFQFSRPLHSF